MICKSDSSIILTHRELNFLYQKIDFHIVKYDIPLCCQIFFWGVWTKIRRDMPYYGEQKYAFVNGIVECPDCLIKRLKELKHEIN